MYDSPEPLNVVAALGRSTDTIVSCRYSFVNADGSPGWTYDVFRSGEQFYYPGYYDPLFFDPLHEASRQSVFNGGSPCPVSWSDGNGAAHTFISDRRASESTGLYEPLDLAVVGGGLVLVIWLAFCGFKLVKGLIELVDGQAPPVDVYRDGTRARSGRLRRGIY